MPKYWRWILSISGATLFLGLLLCFFLLYRLFYQPMNFQGKNPIICVKPSTTATAFVANLKKLHLIQSDQLFLLFLRLQGVSQQLKSGVYEVKPGESAQQFLYRVVEGDTLKFKFSIIEGTTTADIAANLAKAPYLLHTQKAWQLVFPDVKQPEGLILADTYEYQADTQSSVLLALAHRNLKTYLEYSWQQRSSNLPYKDAYQLLIAASILEKESAVPREKTLISGVIVNRLQRHMPLQMDPTVIYALGTHYAGHLTRNDLHVDSPYNTYRYAGLPPTPIAVVGKVAIDAAAHPEITPYLYFVAKGDGTHQFSATYAEHQQAVRRYQRKN